MLDDALAQIADLGLFSEDDLLNLSARTSDRESRGKTSKYVRCLIRDKEVQLKSEEILRQLWLSRLIHTYGYPKNRIAVECPITFGRDTSKRADIVVFDADRPTVPYIIIEVKQSKLRDGKEQLRSYCHATGAPLALWSNGALTEIWHRKNPNYFVSIHHLPSVSQTIEDIVNQPWPSGSSLLLRCPRCHTLRQPKRFRHRLQLLGRRAGGEAGIAHVFGDRSLLPLEKGGRIDEKVSGGEIGIKLQCRGGRG